MCHLYHSWWLEYVEDRAVSDVWHSSSFDIAITLLYLLLCRGLSHIFHKSERYTLMTPIFPLNRTLWNTGNTSRGEWFCLIVKSHEKEVVKEMTSPRQTFQFQETPRVAASHTKFILSRNSISRQVYKRSQFYPCVYNSVNLHSQVTIWFKMSTAELATSYAALILADEGLDITVRTDGASVWETGAN